MKKKSLIIFLAFAMSLAGATVVYTCAFESTFRAYLDRRFWQPLAKFAEEILKNSSPPSEQPAPPFAGMAANGGKPALQSVRDAYRPLSRSGYPPLPLETEAVRDLYAEARTAVAAAIQTDLTAQESEEVRLVEAKIDMREGEVGNQESLQQVQEKLQSFLSIARTPALASEARGWLARVHYLRGNYSSAAKIYLDELAVANSSLSRKTLLTSLRNLFPYNGSSSRLADHLEEYFDTPRYALFVVNLVTNPVYFDPEERRAMSTVAKQVLAALHNHRELFRSGPESEALTLALMRAALYMGDIKAALTYSRLPPPTSATANDPDFNWMIAACHFLQQDYAAAEAPLLRIYRTTKRGDRIRIVTAQALVGVYQKLRRPVDQLHAAFLYEQSRAETSVREEQLYEEGDDLMLGLSHKFVEWPYAGWLIDLSYLLDIQLTDRELRAYLKRYPRSSRPLRFVTLRNRSATEMIEYALAVRHARREEYMQAATFYRKLGSWPRAARMRQLAKLYARANDPARTKQERLEARYVYAVFLADHPNGVFYNDMLWHGLQRYAFTNFHMEPSYGNSTDVQELTQQEQEFFQQQAQRVREEQEERWRAYKILATIVKETGPSPLGRRAAKKALACLRPINGRFGDDQELQAMITELAQ